MASQKWQSATVLNHFNLASTFHYFILETEQAINFLPGQYLSVKVSEGGIRDYSIAGSDIPNKFSFLINTAPGGVGSKYFENLKVGDEISYLGPFGNFTFREDGAGHVLFLATGAGFTPFKVILEDILQKRHLKIPVTLYLGLTFTSDIFFEDYLEILKQQYPNFDYKIVIWKPDSGWQGLTGFITDQVQKDFPNMKNFSAYLCGNKIMVENGVAMLQSQGLPKEKIYTEKQ